MVMESFMRSQAGSTTKRTVGKWSKFRQLMFDICKKCIHSLLVGLPPAKSRERGWEELWDVSACSNDCEGFHDYVRQLGG